MQVEKKSWYEGKNRYIWFTEELKEEDKVRKPIFHLTTFFARREAKTRIRQRDWLKLAGENIRCEQVGSVLTFLSARANKFA